MLTPFMAEDCSTLVGEGIAPCAAVSFSAFGGLCRALFFAAAYYVDIEERHGRT